MTTSPNPVTALNIQLRDGQCLRWVFNKPLDQAKLMGELGKFLEGLRHYEPMFQPPATTTNYPHISIQAMCRQLLSVALNNGVILINPDLGVSKAEDVSPASLLGMANCLTSLIASESI